MDVQVRKSGGCNAELTQSRPVIEYRFTYASGNPWFGANIRPEVYQKSQSLELWEWKEMRLYQDLCFESILFPGRAPIGGQLVGK